MEVAPSFVGRRRASGTGQAEAAQGEGKGPTGSATLRPRRVQRRGGRNLPAPLWTPAGLGPLAAAAVACPVAASPSPRAPSLSSDPSKPREAASKPTAASSTLFFPSLSFPLSRPTPSFDLSAQGRERCSWTNARVPASSHQAKPASAQTSSASSAGYALTTRPASLRAPGPTYVRPLCWLTRSRRACRVADRQSNRSPCSLAPSSLGAQLRLPSSPSAAAGAAAASPRNLPPARPLLPSCRQCRRPRCHPGPRPGQRSSSGRAS